MRRSGASAPNPIAPHRLSCFEPPMSLDGRFDAVIAGAKAGATWALEAIYLDLQPRLLRYLGAIEPEFSEDLATETWLGLSRALPSFEGDEGSLRALLFTIARRRVLDHRRREARRRTVSTDPADIARLGPVADAEHEALDRVGTDWALARIATLPSDQAEVLVLRVIADLSVQEVATIVGKRPGAVRALQLRGLRRLARELSGEPVTR